MTKKIYILLPVHNRKEITRKFVRCLKQQTYKNYHLVLIDDGSTDGTASIVREEMLSTTVIQGAGDWWWAGSLQKGYNWLRSVAALPQDLVLIINDDTHFEQEFLNRAVEILHSKERTLLLAQCYEERTGDLLDSGVHVDWRRLSFNQAKTASEINCLSTRGVFMRVSEFLEIGGFYPKRLPQYLSDYEFTIRAGRKQMSLVTDPSVKLWISEQNDPKEFYGGDFSAYIKNLFSRRNPSDPFAWISFVILACPWPWKPLHVLRISARVAADISKYYFRNSHAG